MVEVSGSPAPLDRGVLSVSLFLLAKAANNWPTHRYHRVRDLKTKRPSPLKERVKYFVLLNENNKR
jgi:hypothetical protein